MQVSLSVKTKSECELSFFPDVQFCAGSFNLVRRDTCNVLLFLTNTISNSQIQFSNLKGDSGGPLMKYYNNRWTLGTYNLKKNSKAYIIFI
jgi:hypothetical protein